MFQNVGLDLVGDGPPLLGVAFLALTLGQFGPPVQGDPAHHLRRREVLRLAAHLPDSPVGLTPMLDGLFHLPLQHRP
ncbi:Uncharacterised protein [Mycobacterium tuberculosis]|nr:Uncharacterised protein [Mycobacterium tuberculosis]